MTTEQRIGRLAQLIEAVQAQLTTDLHLLQRDVAMLMRDVGHILMLVQEIRERIPSDLSVDEARDLIAAVRLHIHALPLLDQRVGLLELQRAAGGD